MKRNQMGQFISKISFKSKLWFIIGIQFFAVFLVTLLAVSNINQATQLLQIIHRDSFDSANLILNADRDLYQALNDFEKKHDVKSQDYLENVDQVRDRVAEARKILEQERSRWDKYYLKDSQKTVFNVFDEFFKEFDA